MTPIHILLADDHPAFLAGIRSELEKEPDMVVIGTATDGVHALARTRELRPDVLLLDMSMPGLMGVEVARRLHEEGLGVHVLPLSGFHDAEYVLGVLDHGAMGYLSKDEPLSEILAAIRKVAGGGVHISSRVSFELLQSRLRSDEQSLPPEARRALWEARGFTAVLLTILRLVAQGFNNEQIATRLNRSEHTVRNHVSRLLQLTDVRWRPALVAWAWKNGIVEPSEAAEEWPQPPDVSEWH